MEDKEILHAGKRSHSLFKPTKKAYSQKDRQIDKPWSREFPGEESSVVGSVSNGQLPLCLPFIPSVMLHLQGDGVLDDAMSATAGELEWMFVKAWASGFCFFIARSSRPLLTALWLKLSSRLLLQQLLTSEIQFSS